MDTDREEWEFGNSRPSDPHMSPGKALESQEGEQGGLGTVLRAENSLGPRGCRLKGRAKEKKN